MFKSRISISAVPLLLLGISQPALPWADMGHQIVGAVAEKTIKPTTKDFVRGILGVEPFEVAAIWPDHVRDDNRFGHDPTDPQTPVNPPDADDHDFSPYHFCEIPAGKTYDNRPTKYVKDAYGVITHAMDILEKTDGSVSREEKLIAMRYLIHVVGDIHQPLHVGNGYDLGGNACRIKWQETVYEVIQNPQGQFVNTKVTRMVSANFHSFWDDNLVRIVGQRLPKSAIYLNGYMDGLSQKYPDMLTMAAKQKYAAGTVKDWLQEAQVIRENGVYPDNPGEMANYPSDEKYKHRPYCQWFTDQENHIPGPGVPPKIADADVRELSADYINTNVPLVENQMLKGGLRLAALLDQVADAALAASPGVVTLNNAAQEKVLADVQNAFRNKALPF